MLGSLVSLGIVYAANTVKKFPDVDYASWYGGSVDIMSARGVINGYENGNFGPNDAVTRAQFVTMLDKNDTLSPNYNRIMDLRTLICVGMGKEAFPADDATWGNVQKVYENVCEKPWYL